MLVAYCGRNGIIDLIQPLVSLVLLVNYFFKVQIQKNCVCYYHISFLHQLKFNVVSLFCPLIAFTTDD